MYTAALEEGGRGVESGLQLEGDVQHAESDAGWRLGRRNSGLNLDPKTQLGLGVGLGLGSELG